jgi:hypothetical protein
MSFGASGVKNQIDANGHQFEKYCIFLPPHVRLVLLLIVRHSQ